MARPRKPTHVLELSGAFQKNPQRRRAREAEPEITLGVGDPPAGLTTLEDAAWREIAQTAHVGILSAGDRIAVEMAARLLAEFRAAPLAFPNARLTRLNHLLSSFGMTPSARSLVAALRPAAESRRENKFASHVAFFRRRQG